MNVNGRRAAAEHGTIKERKSVRVSFLPIWYSRLRPRRSYRELRRPVRTLCIENEASPGRDHRRGCCATCSTTPWSMRWLFPVAGWAAREAATTPALGRLREQPRPHRRTRWKSRRWVSAALLGPVSAVRRAPVPDRRARPARPSPNADYPRDETTCDAFAVRRVPGEGGGPRATLGKSPVWFGWRVQLANLHTAGGTPAETVSLPGFLSVRTDAAPERKSVEGRTGRPAGSIFGLSVSHCAPAEPSQTSTSNSRRRACRWEMAESERANALRPSGQPVASRTKVCSEQPEGVGAKYT